MLHPLTDGGLHPLTDGGLHQSTDGGLHPLMDSVRQVTHDVDDFNTGETVILTLADSRIVSGKRGMTKGPAPSSASLRRHPRTQQ